MIFIDEDLKKRLELKRMEKLVGLVPHTSALSPCATLRSSSLENYVTSYEGTFATLCLRNSCEAVFRSERSRRRYAPVFFARKLCN